MLSFTNTTTAGASQSVAAGTSYIAGNSTGIYLWQATARDLTPGTSGGLASVANESSRSATNTYMRGLAENVRIQTSSGLPWFHRRICFTYKGGNPFRQTYAGDTGASQQYVETSSGMSRLWFNNAINNTPNYLNNIYAVIFKGSQGVDWADLLTASVDNRRVSLRYDRTWTIQSGNQNGVVRERKLWHRMNKSLVFDDDESGLTEDTSYNSVDAKPGMGDYYVMDIILPGQGGSASDVMAISSTSTLYWHER